MSNGTPFNINRHPKGLIALLDSKAEGTTPHVMDSGVNASIDLTPFYEQQIPFQVQGSTPVPASPGGTFSGVGACVVPVGEIWRVTHIAMTSSAFGVGGSCTPQLCIVYQSNFVGTLFTPLGEQARVVNVGEKVGVGWTGSLWLQQGDGPGVSTGPGGGTALTINFQVIGYRYKL
jgi:hypothetical protein